VNKEWDYTNINVSLIYMSRQKLGFRELIFAINSELPLITRLFAKESKYNTLIQTLSEYLNNGENRLPYQKVILEELSLSRTDLMELMNDLYEDFSIKLCQPSSYIISDTEIWLLVKLRDDHWVIGIDGLTIIPRVSEDFFISFIKDEYGSSVMGTIKDIEHQFETGKHIINIYMESRYL